MGRSYYHSWIKSQSLWIETLLGARKTIEKFTEKSVIKVNDWQKEISILEKGIQDLTKDKAKVQEEFKQIDHIKYAVKAVNDDYGIDLSMEIDKASKRGEKPSVIAQLKKFKEQQEKTEQYQKRAKEKHRGEER